MRQVKIKAQHFQIINTGHNLILMAVINIEISKWALNNLDYLCHKVLGCYDLQDAVNLLTTACTTNLLPDS